MSTRIRRLSIAATLAASAALVLSGCVEGGRTSGPSPAGQDEGGATGGATSACPVEVDEDIDSTVRIAFQPIPNGDLIVRDLGWLEACMPNADITWSQFASGGDVVQAFGSNSADLGLMGSSPATKAASAPLNIDMKVIWIHDVIGDAESLVAQKGTATSLEELSGKKIAVPYASTAHYSLLAALERAGMSAGDVEMMNMSPDAMLAAWERKEIDAAWVWAPTLPKLLETGDLVLSAAQTAEDGAPTFDLAGATTAFIAGNPEFMQMWTTLQSEAVTMIKDDPDTAAESIAVQLGITPDEVKPQLDGYVYLDAAEQAEQYFDGQLGEALASTADFLVTQGEIDEASDAQTYADAVYSDAVKAVAGG
ncbi:taurine ABC transporter substrate-binding protein [Ornithinimicrobium panacihumi]|uniref:taurine ABC transporter substrate-binding protein n=1 Tax=Ornithinimicrobium panacihumi TaxID=2008449 RepID=UPI003F8C7C9A